MTIRNYVRRLRQVLGDADRARIRAEPNGYLISAGADELDVTRFTQLLASARAAARGASWAAAAEAAASALSLWRGAPLADVESDVLTLREGARLAEMRLQALETRIEADLHLGRHADVIPELQQLAEEHPLREQLRALLMLALYRCGRQGDALAVYHEARRVLAEDLGVEPGPGLRELQRRILAADPALAVPGQDAQAAATSRPGSALAVVPRQLPRGAARFVGRGAELAALTAAMHEASSGTPETVVISVIGGTSGVGKTALAVHWAHQVAHLFPGGQLYVNLRGFDPSGTPVTAEEAIRGFLGALGVPASQVPPGLDAQAGLYRSVLAGRRMLVVLDNARDSGQVRPLLPASPGCLVLVTSRNQLADLVAVDGAQLLSLDLLTETEAAELLRRRLGAARLAAEQQAAQELIGLCARLPLALCIAAARAATHPRFTLASLAAELRDSGRRLDVLATGEETASLSAVFSWSYQQLSAQGARLFRLLGLHPGPDTSVAAAASLAGVTAGQARRVLHELTQASLLTENSPGRFTFHDLLRAYAAEQARSTESEAGLRSATGRVLDHYLHTAHSAALLLSPSREQVGLTPPAPGVTPERLTTRDQALAWFEAEHHVLIAAVTLAAGTGFDVCAWQLPSALAGFLDRRGHWHEWAATQRIALEAATRLGDRAAQAAACRRLGHACARLGDYARARAYAAECLDLYRQLGNLDGQARVCLDLCWQATQQKNYAGALGHAEQALRLYRELADRAGQANALNSVGWSHAMLGDPRQARTFCQQAIAVSRELGDRQHEGHGWDSLGYAEHQLGNHDEAATCYQRAIRIFREVGDRFNEADALSHLGDARHAAGDRQGARVSWHQALATLDSLHHPDAELVRAKLAGTSSRGQHEPATARTAPR